VGGDRKTLAAGRNVADNNHIAYIGEQDRITDGIFLDGVGNEATHNLLHDAPYNGIRYQGNDEHIAYNEIHHIGLDAGDMGVFYTNGDWAAQGNRVEHNFGHDAPNSNGMYLDDGSTGRTAANNVFYNLASGIFLGGGHDNRLIGNLIFNCRVGIHVDNRGESRKYDLTAKHLVGFLRTIDPNKAPWSTRYPHFLDDILPQPTEPLGNIVENNLVAGAKTAYQVNAPALVDAAKNPSVPSDSVTFDAKTLKFRSAVDGFREVSVAEDGLYLDSYRRRLPTDEETGRFVERTGTMTFDSNVDIKASNKNTKPE
jgi:parallel beta-helix repeat protein